MVMIFEQAERYGGRRRSWTITYGRWVERRRSFRVRGSTNLNITKEAEASILSGFLKFVYTVLSNAIRSFIRTDLCHSHLDFWMIRRNTETDQSKRYRQLFVHVNSHVLAPLHR